MNFFLDVKNKLSGVELSYIPSLNVLGAILKLVGVHGPVPTYTVYDMQLSQSKGLYISKQDCRLNRILTHTVVSRLFRIIHLLGLEKMT